MKALILAAGLGTRLRPYTNQLPKPLFPIAGQPVLDRIIDRLVDAGADRIAINTHHLHRLIADHVASQNYPVPVSIRFEPEILGTGGAIRNNVDFFGDDPFIVINGDIVTDIDIRSVYDIHCGHPYPATLVLHDFPIFNTVTVDTDGFITDFADPAPGVSALAFTGIQVLDASVISRIPDNRFVSSIDVYREMIAEGIKIKAHTVSGHYWNDMGTPERFSEAVFDQMAPDAFAAAFKKPATKTIHKTLLSGDGSDRKWYRLTAGDKTLILADHGLHIGSETAEVDSYVAIGRHLAACGIAVPEIFLHDRFSGLVFSEDLGDTLLQDIIRPIENTADLLAHYKPVVKQIVKMSVTAQDGFDPAWAFQTRTYSRRLIIENECRYFISALVNGYLDLDVDAVSLSHAFEYLADRIHSHSISGFMHRDMQSRNIMVHAGRYCFIDFQGGRIGPVQYDLAALLYDPYVDLPEPVEKKLLARAFDCLSALRSVEYDKFMTGYRYCRISRTMQALGAFGHLTRVKKKPGFAVYIPIALARLQRCLAEENDPELADLSAVADAAARALDKKALLKTKNTGNILEETVCPASKS